MTDLSSLSSGAFTIISTSFEILSETFGPLVTLAKGLSDLLGLIA
ncbi:MULTISPECIES: hypothetical protein [Corynebacterium]|nr:MULTISPECIES: hypothetical protein [Corynebacterium]